MKDTKKEAIESLVEIKKKAKEALDLYWELGEFCNKEVERELNKIDGALKNVIRKLNCSIRQINATVKIRKVRR